MRYGISREDALDGIGKGWSPLIVGLYNMIDHLKEHYKMTVHVAQVKEKFGALRFYYDISNDIGSEDGLTSFNKEQNIEAERFQSKVNAAELFSSFMCEECGSLGTNADHAHHGWYKTLCPVHSQEWFGKIQ